MTLPQPRVLQKLDGAPREIDPYLKTGGYDAWRKCLKDLTPADVVGEIKKPVCVDGAEPVSQPGSSGTRC